LLSDDAKFRGTPILGGSDRVGEARYPGRISTNNRLFEELGPEHFPAICCGRSLQLKIAAIFVCYRSYAQSPISANATHSKKSKKNSGKGGDNGRIIWRQSGSSAYWKSRSVSDICKPALSYLAILIACALLPTCANAQWWQFHAPRDFEECAESAEKTASSKDERASLMSECDSKFAGRRKPDGGYTYYDFMQNRHFDIAGPNPTPEELKQIDQQYTEFLDQRRQSVIAAALSEKQNQQTQDDLVKEAPYAPSGLTVPIPVRRPQIRAKATNCDEYLLSCGWSGFTAKIQNFKKTLFGSAKKPNHE
jgi:hypothetical protein